MPADVVLRPLVGWGRRRVVFPAAIGTLRPPNETMYASNSAQSLWQTLPRPIIGLAPMNGVTDHPFRHIQKKYGAPMVVYTEFTNAEGICNGAATLLQDFLYDESQRPIVAQIYGRTPAYFRQTAVVLCQLGFDGIDINMGCPADKVALRGSGAGLIRTPELAQEIVAAVKAGVQDWCNGQTVRDCPDLPENIVREVEARHQALPPAVQQRRPIPVSVKTRIGYEEPQVREWIPRLLESAPAAIGIHGRTLVQRYAGQADWDAIGLAVELAQESPTLILGNGDVTSLAAGRQRATDFGVDGVLIGRASYGNPFLFNEATTHQHHAPNAAPEDYFRLLDIALEHARFYESSLRHYPRNHFPSMRKHLGWYAHGVPGARFLRREFAKATCAADVAHILEHYFTLRTPWLEQPALPTA